MKKILFISALLVLIALLCWFQPTFMHPVKADSSKTAPVSDSAIIETRGTVVHKGLEGGFFAIESDDGKMYDPINLPEHFKKDGLKVKIRAKLRNDVGSIHMVGDIIEIVEIDSE